MFTSVRILNRTALLISIIPLVMLSNVAIGQEDQTRSGDVDFGNTKKVTQLDEIIVRGQKSYYEENASSATRLDIPIMETPQSLFVINSELIADQQAFRLDQVLQNDSSVQKSNNFLGAYSSYQVRGFPISNGSNYLRDGRSFFHLSAPPVEVLDRVEVLKGPSSVLYGTLAPGGLINMIPKRPFDEQKTSIKATVGSYNLQHIHIDNGGPVTDSGNVRYRVNGVYENSNSFRKFIDGSDFNTKRLTAAAAVDWDIGENTSLRVNFDITHDKRPQDIGLANFTGDFSDQSSELIYNQPWTKYDSDVWNLTTELNHEFTDNLSVRTGVSYQNFRRDRYDNQIRSVPDADGNVFVRVRRRVNRREYTTFYGDIISDFSTGALKHKVLVGADHTDVGIDNNETIRNFTFETNIFNPTILPDPQIITRDEKNLGGEDRTGIYLNDQISIGEHWRFLLGVRYDEFKSVFRGTTTQKAENLTPRIGVLYIAQPNLSFYGSFSQSFEPNPIVSNAFSNAGEILDPTLGEQFEIGVKWEAFEGKLLATGALFTIDRKNAAFEDIITNTIVQTGLQTHKGGEITVSGLVGRHISLTGSATYLSAEFKEDDNVSLIGNTPAGVPELAASFSAEYAFLEGNLEGLSIQGGWFYEADRPIDDANSYDLDAYNRIDLGVKYVLQNEWVLRLTAQNITDTHYFKGRSPFSVNPERPREIRGSIEINF
ncbi:MAG: hypothetical protein COB36_12730 [Alphaproteobacteria bacterium]|nr:MAG: hypothetical protein COB36_12730 [Alphaproteobacteria bacterium]